MGWGRVGCSFIRVFRTSFLEKETVEQRLEGNEWLAMRGERGDGTCRGLSEEMHVTQLLQSSQIGWAEGGEMGDAVGKEGGRVFPAS